MDGQTAERPAIILDCDPGHDDAMAIVVAARHTDLLGITTVSGNAPLDRTTHNALVMRDLLGLDVPVHSGADRPLVAAPRHAPSVHGASGLDGADLPDPTTPLDSTDAVTFLIDTVRSVDGVWLVPVGPLTNIALALRHAPDLVDRVMGISLMGGGTFGNHSPVGEFNIWADPEAAAVVFSSGIPLVMAGLDVTHQFQATPERIATVAAVPGRLGAVLSDLMGFFSAAYIARHDAIGGAPIHDPLAVLAITHRHLFTRSPRHVAVETSGTITRGMTVIDHRTVAARPAPNCDVLDTVDPDAAFAVLLDAIATYSLTRSTP
ncbi:nucleoside hydrolase [soil metagenome]